VPALEVTDLVKRYPGVAAVAGLSFAAQAGQVTAVLGPNGAGKTTTVEICSALRRADAGAVRVLGLDPNRDAAALRARVGVMPQGGSPAGGIYPAARAGEVLRSFAAFYAHPLPVDALLARLDLGQVSRTPWRRLSGGEQQRLSLALCIVGRPELVFLDEPTAGLDVAGRGLTWELIEELKAAGVAVVLTTHAIDEAERIAEAVVIVDEGRVVAAGSPAELTRAAGQRRELRFDAPAGLPLDLLATRLPGGTTAAEPSPGHYVVTGEITPALTAAVTGWCAEQAVMPDHMTTGGRSLEEVFVQLTGKRIPR
jgi:ABC-2 type transport system ATP-binding protein